MRMKTCLSLSDANAMVAAAKEAALRKSLPVAIVVVDEAGHPVQLERLDGAGPTAGTIAGMKASTAALYKIATKDMEAMAKHYPGLALPHFLPIQGGLPVFAKGECVGGIGVSGASAQDDEDTAKAGLAAFETA